MLLFSDQLNNPRLLPIAMDSENQAYYAFAKNIRIMFLNYRRCEEDQLDLYYNARFISANNNVIFGLKAMNNSLAGNSSLNLNYVKF